MKHVLLIITLFGVSASLQAAALAGSVADSTAAAIPGVTVEIVGAGTAPALAVTDAAGRYRLTVPAGSYDVTFRLLNFATLTERVTIGDGAARTLDVTLMLAANADVVVTAKQTFAERTGVISGAELDRRPFQRPGEVLEAMPGVIVSQHSGEGKANQYYLRGFNLDHGTDLAIRVAGVPVNMPTHAHGQGYADANFLIPELVSAIQYTKGPYYAEEGDFASAGAANIHYVNLLEQPLLTAQGGSFGYGRALLAASPRLGEGYLLYALEAVQNEGPWERADDLRKVNALLRYTRGNQTGGFSITASGYDARWNATDQIPTRAVAKGIVSRFGLIDASNGGLTSRYTLASEWLRGSGNKATQASGYAGRYRLNLFSNFTYFLDDPERGDQFEQEDDRWFMGGSASHRWLGPWGSENVAGVQLRHDDIRTVGLYHTRDRVRLETTRADRVRQTSGALHAQSSVQWTRWLRTVAGVRGDRYRFALGGTDASADLLSPKLSIILGPWRTAELHVNAGSGFHSNDARAALEKGATPLVLSRGAEVGVRTAPSPRLHAAATLWALDLDSELLFVGDAGTTEARGASRRTGIELATHYDLTPWLGVHADYAYSRARFRDGNRIAGAVEGVASVGLDLVNLRKVSAELRYRYFGPRPLVEDDSVRSNASHLVNARVGYAIAPRLRLSVDVFNVLNAEVSDIDYFYTSRLPGEDAAGVDDVHFHPVEKRAVRVGITTSF
ncbi:MAG TPA: TonB-dependent receptor [Thermoanaerobaculia bacterium]